MRKNTTMRISALLLVLALVTSCFVGGTFAKYTTSANDTVSARVANWGFESTNAIVLDDLFSATYKDPADQKVTVSSADDKLLIAPGTGGNVAFQFKYDKTAGNAPEVAYNFTVDTDGSECSIENGVLVWSLDGRKCGTNGTFAELLAALKLLSGDATGTKEYTPGELPDAFDTTNTAHTISWVWDFDNNGQGTNDTRDTGLGNADTLDDVTLKITITATQID